VSALFATRRLQHHIQRDSNMADIDIVTVPCTTTSAETFQTSLKEIDAQTGSKSVFPTILTHAVTIPGTLSNLAVACLPNDSMREHESKYRFATPAQHLLNKWRLLTEQSSVEFDLVYAPLAFDVLMNAYGDQAKLWTDKDINLLYYHCGGVEGNESMLQRYKYAGLY
jgi:1-aminocyclopropane-1-carboxylate deaminase/D-cysteine desulfhydrase-like pyridoxal-dependent ACC family enzyme